MKTNLPQEARDAMVHALAAGGFPTAEAAAWEVSLTVALAKVGSYERECERFRRKYAAPLAAVRARVAAETEREDFETEEDLADWEFAEAALAQWSHHAEVLRNVAS